LLGRGPHQLARFREVAVELALGIAKALTTRPYNAQALKRTAAIVTGVYGSGSRQPTSSWRSWRVSPRRHVRVRRA
jgi:hypothetical protein